MFKGLWWYFGKEIRPRILELLFEIELWLSVGVGILLGHCYEGQYGGQLPSLFTGLLSYAAIAFGFCIAGLTLALTLPNYDFSVKMAHEKIAGKDKDAYSDLLFVFSWTAILHWLAMTVFVVGILVVTPQWGGTLDVVKRVFLGLCAGTIVYSFTMFLTTLITLAQLGNAYICHLKEPKEPKRPNKRRTRG
jgi:hypothetical protein